MEAFDQEIIRALTSAATDQEPARVIIVAADPNFGDALVPALDQVQPVWENVCTVDQAVERLGEVGVDLLVVCLDESNDDEALAQLNGDAASLDIGGVVIIARHRCFNAAVKSMQLGALDYICLPAPDEQIVARFRDALNRAHAARRRDRRLARLQVICSELNSVRKEIAEQVDILCDDLSGLQRSVSSQISDVAMSSEFRTLVRQELDVEDLLRASLEYLLTKTGPTNAAVFLPEGGDAYGLGAYVNYNCPRESIGLLLDHLSDAICPQLRDEQDIVVFNDAAQLSQWLDLDGGLLDDSQVIAFSCHHHDECLAIVVLFRDEAERFDPSLAPALDTLRTIFAEQLARLIRVHHRAGTNWPEHGFEDEGDYGLAA